ncbi:MAG: hypothetical protein AAF985_11905, partial [Bacteroidota bacterium]
CKRKKLTVSLKILTDKKKHLSAQAKQNFGMEEAEFEQVLRQLQAGDETLFETIFLAQFEDCIKFLMSHYKIHYTLAYDVSMDALLRFRKRLLAGKISYGNMRFLFTRMAGQFLSESKKYKTVMLEEAREEAREEAIIEEEVLDALDQAWKQLCKDCCQLLERFYYQKTALKSIALEQGKTEVALRKRKQRCLDKLRRCFAQYYRK